jgi:hypothetical protein
MDPVPHEEPDDGEPSRASIHAATELSTPPLIATTKRFSGPVMVLQAGF